MPLHTYRLVRPEFPDNPNTFNAIPQDADRCSEIFPEAPQIRCQRKLHLKDTGACYANQRNPYYYVVWERTNDKVQ